MVSKIGITCLLAWTEYKRMAREVWGTLRHVLDTVANKVYNGLGLEAFLALTEERLLYEVAKVAVRCRNKLVNRLKLSYMKQGEDEAIATFKTRVKPVARSVIFKS